ncbi:MAG: hypothetical protein FE78DRAFT_401372 [Acidomyces sp. 'richmondensis']|nr:MAG: hypothetical protein FE78DRAFT_401372 [Acidomyces sp. 'richmondensis']
MCQVELDNQAVISNKRQTESPRCYSIFLGPTIIPIQIDAFLHAYLLHWCLVFRRPRHQIRKARLGSPFLELLVSGRPDSEYLDQLCLEF